MILFCALEFVTPTRDVLAALTGGDQSPFVETLSNTGGKPGTTCRYHDSSSCRATSNGGRDYLKRAVVAAFGWPANQEDDAVYPYTEVDSKGQKLTGANKYTLTFAKGETPPVKGFWSITMYLVDEGWWFVPNPLNKFTVSPRDNLKANADGSVTLYFQNESPGADKEANWLPAPKGEFLPMLRMYYPAETSPSVLNGSWKPPAVVRVS